MTGRGARHRTGFFSSLLAEEWGKTLPQGNKDIVILLRPELYDALQTNEPQWSHLARMTAAHEIGHSALHVGTIRARRDAKQDHLLALRDTSKIPLNERAEEQAFAFGACILVPRKTLMMVDERSMCLNKLSKIYNVSYDLLRNHFRRLGIPGVRQL